MTKLFCFAALARRDPSAFMIEEKRPDVFVVIQTNVGPNTASIDQDLLHFVKVENQCKRL